MKMLTKMKEINKKVFAFQEVLNSINRLIDLSATNPDIQSHETMSQLREILTKSQVVTALMPEED